jgi:hypothetical protein
VAAPKAPESKAAEQKPLDPKAFAARLQAAAAAAATAPAHLAPATPGTKAAPHRAPVTPATPASKAGVPMVAKLAMTALLLFAVGMGAGWLALSLPKTTDRSLLTENPLIPSDGSAKPEGLTKEVAMKPAPLANPWDAAKPVAPAVTAATPAPSKAINKAATVAPKAPAAPKEPELAAEKAVETESPLAMKDEEPEAFSQKEAEAIPKAGAPQAVTVELPKSDLFKNLKPVAETAPKAAPAVAKAPVAAAQAPRATPPAAQSAATAQYAVQVGACTSAQCLENYRKLIQPHLGSHRVEVMQQASVQRVRVEPLTRDQAQQLKQSLEQADPRLKNAYVVKLADRS